MSKYVKRQIKPRTLGEFRLVLIDEASMIDSKLLEITLNAQDAT